jgi:hypothetical protein
LPDIRTTNALWSVPSAANSGELEALRTAQQRQSDELARLTTEATALNIRLSEQQSLIEARSGTEAPP